MKATHTIQLLALALLIMGMTLGVTMAGEVHVRAGALDGDGSAARPFGRLGEAAAVVGPGDRCVVHAGTYRETLTPVRSGTAEQPIVFVAAGDGAAVMSGGETNAGSPLSLRPRVKPADWSPGGMSGSCAAPRKETGRAK